MVAEAPAAGGEAERLCPLHAASVKKMSEQTGRAKYKSGEGCSSTLVGAGTCRAVQSKDLQAGCLA